MPLLVSALLGGLIQAAGTLVGRVLISLGLGYMTFTGIGTLMAAVKTDVLALIGGQGSVVASFAGVLQVGTCVNIMASAIMIKLTMAGLTSGAVTRMVYK